MPRMDSESSSSFEINPLIYTQRHTYNSQPSTSSDLSSISYAYPTDKLAKTKHVSYSSLSDASQTKSMSHTTKLSSIVSYLLERKTSIYGPTQSPKERCIFILIIATMTFCGMNNDFLGKLSYQSLPGSSTGFNGFENRYWIAWLLTFGTFIICATAIIFGWNKGKEWEKLKREWKYFLFNVSIPGNTLKINESSNTQLGLRMFQAHVTFG